MTEPACDYCDAGVPRVDGWHVIEDPEGFEATLRVPCSRNVCDQQWCELSLDHAGPHKIGRSP